MRAVLLLLCGAAFAGDDVVAQLLAVDAPARDYETDPLVAELGALKRPPDDAPLDDLLDYWEGEGHDPSPALVQRLVEACRAEPRLLPSVIRLLPDTPETRAFVKAWFESADARTYPAPGRASDVRRWLEEEPDPDPESLEDLAAASLARAFAFARKLAAEEDPVLAEYGLCFLVAYGSPGEERGRAVARLRAIAADTELDAESRRWALATIAHEGFDEASLAALLAEEGELDLSPLAEADPDRMIPVAAAVVAKEPGLVRDRAAYCLLCCGDRADALRPLLPLLQDPAWADVDRSWLVHRLSNVDLPECIPGLLHLLEHETDEEILDPLFAALARHRVAEAAPALRARYDALEYGPELFAAAVRCGAIPRDEIVEAVREYARTPDGGDVSHAGMLGWFLADVPPDDEAVAAALLEGATPEVAEIVHAWPGPLSAKDLVRRIGDGTASARSVEAALGRRDELGKLEADELRRILREGRGVPRGVAAALLGAPDPLDGDDNDARRALLACARLLRLPLPAGKVASLLPDDAALAYLVALDTPDVRRVLEDRMEDDPRPGFFSNDPALREVYALKSFDEDGAKEIAVLVYDGRAILRWSDDPARRHTRVLAKGEAESLAAFVARHRIDDLPHLPHLADDGTTYEYLHLTPERGRRLVLDDPDCAEDADVYWTLVRRFARLTERSSATTRYAIEDLVQGVQVLARGGVEEAWASGADVRVARGDGWRTLAGAEAPEPPMDTDLKRSRPGDGVPLNGGRTLRFDGDRLSVAADDQETVLHEGRCGFGVLSPDRRWLVIAIADGDWSVPNGILRVDLATLAVKELDLPRADTNTPVAWLPAHRAFLVHREGDNAKSVLLDPATGATAEVRGPIWPLVRMGPRGLQPTGRPDEYWAATSDEQGTDVGRYDAKAFAFTVVRRFPALSFESDAMWVDGGFAYAVYKGDLLRLPLAEATPTPGR